MESKVKHKDLKEITKAYGILFNHPEARRVLEDLEVSFCGDTFDGNPFQSAYYQGQRSVLLYIERMVAMSKPGGIVE